ncbi:MAG: TM2 domain-containing protein [Spirochaetaceae bacterium]|nr:TM2 domain-containing protein [Spirochaetaceae bacterium]MBQ4331531.1 TM2 domain-containing protein [Spirochaetaceae bacterium]
MDTEQQAIENTQQQLPANNSGTAQEISPKSRLIAFLLCTFAGYVGAHNFYVGRIRRGIIQLLLIVSSFIVYFCSLLYLVLSNVDNPDAADAVFVGVFISLIPIMATAIWIFVDWIMILAGAFKDKQKRPLKNWSVND